MSTLEQDDTPRLVAGRRPHGRLRRFGALLFAAISAQYTIVSIMVSLSVAGALRAFVTPQIVAKFEALAEALKR